jgi:type VI secretion system protein VasI
MGKSTGVLLSTALAGLITVITAANAQQYKACIAIKNDLDRLACYDAQSGRTPKVTISPATSGKWQVQTETSKINDRTNVYLSVESEESVDCGWNRGDRIRLHIYCRDNTTSLVLQTGCHMTSSKYNDYGTVDFRIDKEKARRLDMSESTNNRSLGLWSGGSSIPVIKAMLGKSTVVVRATPYGENPFTASFDIRGLNQAIPPVRKHCGW